MNKKLIALAVASVMAGPAIASAADVEIYGKARMSLGQVNNDNQAANQSDSEISITSHDSRFGIKGSEDLGNGLTAVYQIESKVDLDNGGGKLAGRDSFVGLAGGFGTVVLGHHDTPYKLATKKSDLWADTYADIDKTILSAHNDRIENVLAYISPDMGGFTFLGAYSPDSGLGDNNDDLDGSDPEDHEDAISLAVMGKIGPVAVSLAHQSVSNLADNLLVGGDPEESADGTKLSGIYSFGDMGSVGLVYEMVEIDEVEQDNIVLTGKFKISDTTALKAIYGTRETDTGVANADEQEGTFIAFGMSTKLSKTVEAYWLYTAADNEKSGDVSIKGVDAMGAGTDSEASAFAVGLNVNFSSK